MGSPTISNPSAEPSSIDYTESQETATASPGSTTPASAKQSPKPSAKASNKASPTPTKTHEPIYGGQLLAPIKSTAGFPSIPSPDSRLRQSVTLKSTEVRQGGTLEGEFVIENTSLDFVYLPHPRGGCIYDRGVWDRNGEWAGGRSIFGNRCGGTSYSEYKPLEVKRITFTLDTLGLYVDGDRQPLPPGTYQGARGIEINTCYGDPGGDICGAIWFASPVPFNIRP